MLHDIIFMNANIIVLLLIYKSLTFNLQLLYKKRDSS